MREEAIGNHEFAELEKSFSIINSYNDSVGLIPSETEEDLWNIDEAVPQSLSSELAFDLTARKFSSTYTMMLRSENPYFKITGGYLSDLFRGRLLIPQIVERIPSNNRPMAEGSLGVSAQEENSRIKAVLAISSIHTLETQTHLTLALGLVHESIHIKELFNWVHANKNDPSSASEKVTEYRKRITNPRVVVQEESEAYGVSCEALIYQLGLGDFDIYPEDVELAAKYISLGMKIEDPHWQKLIHDRYLLNIPFTLDPK